MCFHYRLKHKNEEEKHEYDTADGSQHQDVDVKWKTMGHREKDCCVYVATKELQETVACA